MKKVVFGFILGVILTVSIGVVATSLLATDIDYKDNKKVSDALDDLYTKTNTGIFNELSIRSRVQTYQTNDAGSYIFMADFSDNYNKYTVTALTKETDETDKCKIEAWSISANNYVTLIPNQSYDIKNANNVMDVTVLKVTTNSTTANKLAQCTATLLFEK